MSGRCGACVGFCRCGIRLADSCTGSDRTGGSDRSAGDGLPGTDCRGFAGRASRKGKGRPAAFRPAAAGRFRADAESPHSPRSVFPAGLHSVRSRAGVRLRGGTCGRRGACPPHGIPCGPSGFVRFVPAAARCRNGCPERLRRTDAPEPVGTPPGPVPEVSVRRVPSAGLFLR